MAKEELIEMNGVVAEVLPDSRFRIDCENGHKLIAYTSGKMKKNHIRILAGDQSQPGTVAVRPQQRPYHLPPYRKAQQRRAAKAGFPRQPSLKP